MNHIKQTVKEAVKKGGYDLHIRPYDEPSIEERILLDPSFWRSLGVAKKWGVLHRGQGAEHYTNYEFESVWHYVWHAFIDHLAEGKDAESFFEKLI